MGVTGVTRRHVRGGWAGGRRCLGLPAACPPPPWCLVQPLFQRRGRKTGSLPVAGCHGPVARNAAWQATTDVGRATPPPGCCPRCARRFGSWLPWGMWSSTTGGGYRPTPAPPEPPAAAVAGGASSTARVGGLGAPLHLRAPGWCGGLPWRPHPPPTPPHHPHDLHRPWASHSKRDGPSSPPPKRGGRGEIKKKKKKNECSVVTVREATPPPPPSPSPGEPRGFRDWAVRAPPPSGGRGPGTAGW